MTQRARGRRGRRHRPACAWRAAARGHGGSPCSTRRPARGASWVAGGMLAPVTEAWPGEEAAARRWAWSRCAAGRASPPSSRAAAGSTGRAAHARARSSSPSSTRRPRRARHRSPRYLGGLGRAGRRGSPAASCAGWNPRSGPTCAAGCSVPGDLAVDNRALLAALRRRATAGRAVRRARPPTRSSTTATSVAAASAAPTRRIVAADVGARAPPARTAAGCIRRWPGSCARSRARSCGCAAPGAALPPPRRTVRAARRRAAGLPGAAGRRRPRASAPPSTRPGSTPR